MTHGLKKTQQHVKCKTKLPLNKCVKCHPRPLVGAQLLPACSMSSAIRSASPLMIISAASTTHIWRAALNCQPPTNPCQFSERVCQLCLPPLSSWLLIDMNFFSLLGSVLPPTSAPPLLHRPPERKKRERDVLKPASLLLFSFVHYSFCALLNSDATLEPWSVLAPGVTSEGQRN